MENFFFWKYKKFINFNFFYFIVWFLFFFGMAEFFNSWRNFFLYKVNKVLHYAIIWYSLLLMNCLKVVVRHSLAHKLLISKFKLFPIYFKNLALIQLDKKVQIFDLILTFKLFILKFELFQNFNLPTILINFCFFPFFHFSGLNFDRFVERFDEPTLNKMRQQYWTAKQLIRKKLGKKVN